MPRVRHGVARVIRGVQEVRPNDEVLSDEQRSSYFEPDILDTTRGGWIDGFILTSLEHQVETAREMGMTVEEIQNGPRKTS